MILTKHIRKPAQYKIELTNICNAKCVFCTYKAMTRAKGVMRDEVFALAAEQLGEMGCEYLTVTPVVGESLLDPQFPERFGILAEKAAITRCCFFTNLIALDRFDDSQVMKILHHAHCIIISLAPTRESYAEAFGVDRFDDVLRALRRLAELNRRVSMPSRFLLRGRSTTDVQPDSRLAELVTTLQGGMLPTTTTFNDWGGELTSPDGMSVRRVDRRGVGILPCKQALTPVIFWDGRIGLCSCADYDGRLVLGHIQKEGLQAVVRSSRRRDIVRSFLSGKMPSYCAQCSFYTPPVKRRGLPNAIYKL